MPKALVLLGCSDLKTPNIWEEYANLPNIWEKYVVWLIYLVYKSKGMTRMMHNIKVFISKATHKTAELYKEKHDLHTFIRILERKIIRAKTTSREWDYIKYDRIRLKYLFASTLYENNITSIKSATIKWGYNITYNKIKNMFELSIIK